MAKNLADIVGRKPLEDIVKSLKVAAAPYNTTNEPVDKNGYYPKAGDEQEFEDKHTIKKTADANGNGDEVFNASEIEHAQQKPEEKRHGYKKPEDKTASFKPAGKQVAEETELDEISTYDSASDAKAKNLVNAQIRRRNLRDTAPGGLVNRANRVQPVHTTEAAELSDKQKKIAGLRPPKDKIDGADLAALRAGEHKKLKEEKDEEGGMAKSQLDEIANRAKALSVMMKEDQQLEAWVQGKITQAKQHIDEVHDYMKNRGKDKEIEEKTDPKKFKKTEAPLNVYPGKASSYDEPLNSRV